MKEKSFNEGVQYCQMRIEQGMEFLGKDFGYVSLVSFVTKPEIPQKASREDLTDKAEMFSHEFNDLCYDGWDDGSCNGFIFLPLIENTYIKFEVAS